ncbi:MAG: hypothetical protein ACTTJJ_07030 [Prevotella fusca]|uniref:hypothetical protein n=1 Tax=Prevotella fusca TaxID=589436 RepID=UPI003FA12B35
MFNKECYPAMFHPLPLYRKKQLNIKSFEFTKAKYKKNKAEYKNCNTEYKICIFCPTKKMGECSWERREDN